MCGIFRFFLWLHNCDNNSKNVINNKILSYFPIQASWECLKMLKSMWKMRKTFLSKILKHGFNSFFEL